MQRYGSASAISRARWRAGYRWPNGEVPVSASPGRRGLASWHRWPGWLLYAPAVPRFVSLCLRYRLGPLALLKANPVWRYGGSVFESKFARYQPFAGRMGIVPTVLVRAGEASAAGSLERRLVEAGIEFPVVAKPDLGHHSLGVVMVDDLAALRAHLARRRDDWLVQPYVALPCELSAYYYRLPGQPGGTLLELTERILPAVPGGDSSSTWQPGVDHRRNVSAAPAPRPGVRGGQGGVRRANEVGLAALTADIGAGTTLLDRRGWRHEGLVRRLDELVAGVPFFVGVFDFKCPSRESLGTGQRLQVFEINGLTAALSRIRDPGCTYREALAAMGQQLEVIFRVASRNRECPAPGVRETLVRLIAAWHANRGVR